jgi:hypothetical protein
MHARVWGIRFGHLTHPCVTPMRYSALDEAPQDFKERAQKAECGHYWRSAIRG